jgi:anaerobic magnesium-protoporphyrin IX monomethyl ester cyclase
MKIVFSEYSYGSEEGNKWFNSGIAALSGYLKRAGHDVRLLRYVEGDDERAFGEQLHDARPDLSAFSTMSFQWGRTQRLAALSKEVLPEVPVVVGGYHSTFHTRDVIGSPHVDFACRGEGEEALLDLVEALEGGGAHPLHAIPGLVSRHDGAVVEGPARPPVADLDALPVWDRDLFDYDDLLRHRGRANFYFETNVMAIAAARGCPYTCTYCSNESYLRFYEGAGNYIRTRSVPNLLHEMRLLHARYPIRKFEFWDELFGLNPRWVAEFAGAYKADFPETPYSILLRIEQTRNASFLMCLAESGCQMVSMGVESGNEEYRRKYLDRKMTNAEIIEAFKRCRDHGIETTAFNIIGLPFETPEMMRETLELNRRIEPDAMEIFVFQPFPGTILYRICEEQGWIPKNDLNPYWFLTPDRAIRQPSYKPEEAIAIHREFVALKEALAVKRQARLQARLASAPSEAEARKNASVRLWLWEREAERV